MRKSLFLLLLLSVGVWFVVRDRPNSESASARIVSPASNWLPPAKRPGLDPATLGGGSAPLPQPSPLPQRSAPPQAPPSSKLLNAPAPSLTRERWADAQVLGSWESQKGTDLRRLTLLQPASLPYPIRIEQSAREISKPQPLASNSEPAPRFPLRTTTEMVADRILVKPGASDIQAIAARLGATVEKRVGGVFRLRLATLSPDGVPQALALLASEPGVRAEPDYIVHTLVTPDDPSYSDGTLWGQHNTGQAGGTSDADIDAPEGWEIRRTAPDVTVAVIDTGIRTTHQDLQANLWMNPGESGLDPLGNNKAANGIDDDGNGYIDDLHGINSITGSGNPNDDNGHGTHCAGTIAARGNNGLGVTGVAWETRLMALKFLSAEGAGAISDAIECLEYARTNGAHLLSNSWGGGDYSQALYETLLDARDADQLFVVAAGNSSSNNDYEVVYPSSYAVENILSVASMNRLEALSSFSNYGFGSVHVAAPGSGITSTYIDSDASYTVLNGTSMACPHVAGIAALLRQQFPADSYRQILHRIHRSVDLLPAYTGKVQTNGRVNLDSALRTSKNTPSNDDFSEPLQITGTESALLTYNLGATAEPGEPLHAGVAPLRTLWFSYTAPFTGAFVVNTDGSEIDTTLAVYSGTSLTALTPLAANDDDGAKLSSRLRVEVTAGATYRIVVGSKTGAEGLLFVAFARPPGNDDFVNATTLTGDAVGIDGLNLNASKELSEPNHANSPGGSSVWFTWTAPQTAVYSIATVGGTYFDSVLAVYTGNSVANLTQVAANDDYNAFASSRLTLPASAGTTYRIAVDAKDGVGGVFRLTIGIPPLNDNFADAIEITGSLPAVVTGRNFGATVEAGEPFHSTREDVPSSNSVWWKWVAPASQAYQVSLDGSNFDTVLAVYRGSSLGQLTRLGANDDFIGPLSFLTFTATAGETYYFAVDGFSGASGNIELRVLPPPVAMTNDYFADRIRLFGPEVSTEGSNIGAQHEYPAETIGAFVPYPGSSDIYENRTVWWEWSAPADGLVTIDTRFSTFDTCLFVYQGNTLNNLTPVVWNHDIGEEAGTYYRQSEVSFTATRGTRYQIMVMGFGWTHFGSVLLHLHQPLANQPPRLVSASLSAQGEIFSDQALSVSGLSASDPEGDAVSFAYQWQTSTDGGNTWADRIGMNSASIFPDVTGAYWRCLVTPQDATSNGEPFATESVAVELRPITTAVLGQPYSYNPGLALAASATPGERKVLLTEISQGVNGKSEWFEFVVLRPIDLRRFYFQTSTGGALVLTSDPLWATLPVGTLVVLYDAAERDPALPPDDFDPSDGTLVIPSTSATHIRQDLGNEKPWFYAQTAEENALALNDAIRITDARWNPDDISFPAAGSLYDGIQWGYFGNAINADSPNVFVTDGLAPNQSLAFVGDSSALAENAAAWFRNTASAADVTPGQPNTLGQALWLQGLRDTSPRYRLAYTSEALPAGLSLNPATGTLSGVPLGTASQTVNIVLERYNTTQYKRRSFTLRIASPGVSNAIVSEPFAYPPGQPLVGQTATGTGLSGSWATPNSISTTVEAGSLQSGTLPVAGGRLRTTAAATADLYIPLSTAAKNALNPPANGSRTIWLSFATRIPSLGGQPGFHLARDASTPVAGVRLTNSSGQFAAIRNGASTGTGTFSPTGAITSSSEYYVLARFIVTNLSGNASDGWGGATPGTIAADVWVYPLATPPANPPQGSGTAFYGAQTDGTGTRYINGLLLRGSSAGSNFQMDEIRVGTTFEQVALDPANAAPGGLIATPDGAHRIQLGWSDYATNESGYRVEVSTNGMEWTTLTTRPADSTSATHESLPPGATRFYRVCATSNSGDSGYSAIAFATTLSALADWRLTHFGTPANEGNAADPADPDADGFANLLEFALGTSPQAPSERPECVINIVANHLTLSFTPQRVEGLTYWIDAGNDLTGWTETQLTGLIEGESHTHIDSANLSGTPRRFLRLRVLSSGL